MQRSAEVADLKERLLPGAPDASRERAGDPREPGGCRLEEERARYAALEPEGLFSRQAMGLGGDRMDLP